MTKPALLVPLTVKLPPRLLATVKREAEAAHQTPSAYVRRLLIVTGARIPTEKP